MGGRQVNSILESTGNRKLQNMDKSIAISLLICALSLSVTWTQGCTCDDKRCQDKPDQTHWDCGSLYEEIAQTQCKELKEKLAVGKEVWTCEKMKKWCVDPMKIERIEELVADMFCYQTCFCQ